MIINREHANEGSKIWRSCDKIGARISLNCTEKCTRASWNIEKCDTISFYRFNLRAYPTKERKKLVAALDNRATN